MKNNRPHLRALDVLPFIADGTTSVECRSEAMLQQIEQIPIISKMFARLNPPPQQQTLREQIERVMANYDRHIVPQSPEKQMVHYREGMRLVSIVLIIARELAKALNDPYLKPILAKELLENYHNAFREALDNARSIEFQTKNTKKVAPQAHIKFENDSDTAITFAKGIVRADPIILYLKGKIRLERAAKEIRRLATNMSENIDTLFRLLLEQFQIEIGALDGNQISNKEPDEIIKEDRITGVMRVQKASFILEDLYGEISVKFFRDTVALDDNNKTVWRTTTGCLTNRAHKKLRILETEIKDRHLGADPISERELEKDRCRTGLMLRVCQRTHFALLRSSEEKELSTTYNENTNFNINQEGFNFKNQSLDKTPEEYALSQISRRYDIGSLEAVRIKNLIINQLKCIPLTISCDVSTLFRKRSDNRALPFYGAEYKNRQVLSIHNYRLKDIFEDPEIPERKTVTTIGYKSQDYVRSRGINYMRWRREKDEMETGFHNLETEDLPIFGALNPNFDKISNAGLNRDGYDKKNNRFSENEQHHGVNYYGDIHFLLKDKLRSRSTFIARSANHLKRFRIERIDLRLLLADMFRLEMYKYIDAMVAKAFDGPMLFVTHMEGEVHVYGGLNLTTDVKKVFVPSDLVEEPKGPGKRLLIFAKEHGITVQEIGKKPIRIKVYSTDWFKRRFCQSRQE